MDQGATQAFTATVTGSSNTAISWQVLEAGGGSISSTGVYTAPNKAGTFHIVATSQADPSKSATATVTLGSVQVFLDQGDITIDSREQYTFSATVVSTVDQGVSWSVQEGAAGGSVSSSGVYTAPAAFGTYHVLATSHADPTQSATATITVAALTVSVSPTGDVLGPRSLRSFSASVNTSLDSSVTWSVQEGAAGGAITAGGVYTAPTSTGLFHVLATSVQNPARSGTAELTIVPSGFLPTGHMASVRNGAASVLLRTGKILIVGGRLFCLFSCKTNTVLSSAELYDVASGTFSATGSMSVARNNPTATLLSDGKVLVAGGGGASAEVYDPSTGTFSPTGSMTGVRTDYTATLLQSGKVLVAGGRDSSKNVLNTAEIYDPATGMFTLTGTLRAARALHTASLVATGKVLIVGGTDANGSLATAELYDATTGTFDGTGNMAAARTSHRATLLANGKVLITGGSDGAPLATAELYDSTHGGFSPVSSMIIGRQNHSATLLPNGTVLVAGGGTPGFSYTAELYDPRSGTFTQTGSMQFARSPVLAVSLEDGRVLVTGGFVNDPELYK
jgi:hypothetical protein